MSATLEELDAWLSEPEAERLEFKEAKSNFHFETLAKYCAALANEGGGKIIFGVTDRRPRRVVGSSAFEEPGRTVASLIRRLGIQKSAVVTTGIGITREVRATTNRTGTMIPFPELQTTTKRDGTTRDKTTSRRRNRRHR